MARMIVGACSSLKPLRLSVATDSMTRLRRSIGGTMGEPSLRAAEGWLAGRRGGGDEEGGGVAARGTVDGVNVEEEEVFLLIVSPDSTAVREAVQKTAASRPVS